MHGGNDIPDVEPELEPVVTENTTSATATENISSVTAPFCLKDVLIDLDLVSFHSNFESEGVDLDILKSLDKDDLKECLREVGVNRFGDRHRICERILIEKRKPTMRMNNESIENEILSENSDLTENISDMEVDSAV